MARVRTHFDPIGPYDLELAAHGASDPTRRRKDAVLELAFEAGGLPAHARVAQRRGGRVEVAVTAGNTDAALAHLRYMLAVDDDHTPFLKKFSRDPLIGDATRRFQGMRPMRRATVQHALLRALCGQLITAREARLLEARLIRRYCARHGELYLPPTRQTFANASVAELCRAGLVARKASTLVRLSRSLDLERLRELPTRAVVARLNRERGLGPWSAGVICLEGLGRKEHGLVGDLTLVKHCTAQLGREATSADTSRLLEPYGEWAGYASLYLMASGVGGKADLEVRRLRDERNRKARRAAAA